jgi:hypothetical protein
MYRMKCILYGRLNFALVCCAHHLYLVVENEAGIISFYPLRMEVKMMEDKSRNKLLSIKN